MKVFDNYSEYINEKKFYDGWKSARNLTEAKRVSYINNAGVSAEQKKSDLRRAEAVLNCIDVMDEFSQARAEDMEVVTEQIKTGIVEIGTYGTMGVGFLFMLSKSLRNTLNEVFKQKKYIHAHKLILPAIITLIPMLGSVVLASAWGAGSETKASRLGRAEAINTALYSPKQFAELTDEQEKEVDEIVKTIYLPPEQAKKTQKSTKGFGIFKSIKTIFKPNKAEKQTMDYINFRTEADKQNFDKIKLNEKEILEAKKDKQLIQNIVEKIDVASQEYAEDVELATGLVMTTALAGGVLTGYITNKILKKFPKLTSARLFVSLGVGIAVPLVMSIYSAKIQKQASRVGRYKVKQEFMNNPEKLIYVDDEKAQNEDGTQYLNNKKRPGFFKFLVQTVKDNKAYDEYLKTDYLEAKKRSMARESIELTPEQEERATQLQMNTFKMFNKLDEKSQNLSESTEAVREMISQGLTGIISMAGLGLTAMFVAKDQQQGAKKMSKKTMIATYAPIVISLLIANVINVFVTKEQKKASKVANMLAIKEMEDYRNFASYASKIKEN